MKQILLTVKGNDDLLQSYINTIWKKAHEDNHKIRIDIVEIKNKIEIF